MPDLLLELFREEIPAPPVRPQPRRGKDGQDTGKFRPQPRRGANGQSQDTSMRAG
jgi:hypothetical protein